MFFMKFRLIYKLNVLVLPAVFNLILFSAKRHHKRKEKDKTEAVKIILLFTQVQSVV